MATVGGAVRIQQGPSRSPRWLAAMVVRRCWNRTTSAARADRVRLSASGTKPIDDSEKPWSSTSATWPSLREEPAELGKLDAERPAGTAGGSDQPFHPAGVLGRSRPPR